MPIPTFDQMFNPTLEALRGLGGSASNQELADSVARVLGLSEAEQSELANNGVQSRFEYRLAWSRSYLKAYGLLENSSRGVWALTPNGQRTETVNPTEVKRAVRSRRAPPVVAIDDEREGGEAGTPLDEETPLDWRRQLLALLLSLSPSHFERLCQRILRESGFTQVEVTGRSGDGGIDGVGKVRIGDLLTFPVLFQCKRFTGSVGPSVVRDFRGAMVGRVDRGLLLTTGSFTRDARAEATRDGAPPIDLVDRDALLEKLKDLRLGLTVVMLESVSVNAEWYESL